MTLGWARNRLEELDASGLFRGAAIDIDPDYGKRRKHTMTLYLEIRQGNTRIGDAYRLDEYFTLEDAIRNEAVTLAGDAGSDILTEGTDEERDRLMQDTIDAASVSLVNPGDSYTDEAGYVWVLVEKED